MGGDTTNIIETLRYTNELLQKLINIGTNIKSEVSLMRQNEGVEGLPIDIEDFIEQYKKFESSKIRFNWLTVKYWHKKKRISPEEMKLNQQIRIHELISRMTDREEFAKLLFENKDSITTEEQLFAIFKPKQLARILGMLGYGKDILKMPSEERIKSVLKNIKSFDFKTWRKSFYAVDQEKLEQYSQFHEFVKQEDE